MSPLISPYQQDWIVWVTWRYPNAEAFATYERGGELYPENEFGDNRAWW
jgi:hypothetical protein